MDQPNEEGNKTTLVVDRYERNQIGAVTSLPLTESAASYVDGK